MPRLAFVMSIHPGQEEEYALRHNPIWPELESKLKEHGVITYSIYRHGLTLFAYVEVEDQSRWDALSETDVVRRWWAHMAPIMPSNADNSPVGEALQEVFHIESVRPPFEFFNQPVER